MVAKDFDFDESLEEGDLSLEGLDDMEEGAGTEFDFEEGEDDEFDLGDLDVGGDPDEDEKIDLGALDTDEEIDLGDLDTEDETLDFDLETDEDDSEEDDFEIDLDEEDDFEIDLDEGDSDTATEAGQAENVEFDVEGKVDELGEGLELATEIVGADPMEADENLAESKDTFEEFADAVDENLAESTDTFEEFAEDPPLEILESDMETENDLETNLSMEDDFSALDLEEETTAPPPEAPPVTMDEEPLELLEDDMVQETNNTLEDDFSALDLEKDTAIKQDFLTVGLDDEDLAPSENPVGLGDKISLESSSQAMEVAPVATGLGQDLLLQIRHELSVELGRVQMQGRDITELTYGSVVELEKMAGDPVELVLNGKVVAFGEVVLINQKKIGVRIIGIQQN